MSVLQLISEQQAFESCACGAAVGVSMAVAIGSRSGSRCGTCLHFAVSWD
jgi:hypothetical protein